LLIFVVAMKLLKILFCVFLLGHETGFAQDSTDVPVGDRNILYRKEASGGMILHSNGLGIVFKSGRQVTAYKKRIICLDFVSVKDPKEYKVTNPNLIENSKPFAFGKLNYVYFFRAGWGYQNTVFSKAERGGVEVRFNYFGGFTLALAKPMYLDVIIDSASSDRYIVYETMRYNPNDPNQQNVTDFVGRGPFFSGFGETKLYPGVHAKTSFSFEYSGWQRKIAALEAGVTFDYFPDAIPMMARNPSQNLFFNFFISLMWGAKYN
jgi:hypothetical protein